MSSYLTEVAITVRLVVFVRLSRYAVRFSCWSTLYANTIYAGDVSNWALQVTVQETNSLHYYYACPDFIYHENELRYIQLSP